MNGNGQVVVAGLFLVMSMAVAMVAVGMFEIPTFEPEAKPIELLSAKTDEANFSPAPIELLSVITDEAIFSPAPIELLEVKTDEAIFGPASIELLFQHEDSAEQGLTPEQIYREVSAQALAQERSVVQNQAHSGACSGRY